MSAPAVIAITGGVGGAKLCLGLAGDMEQGSLCCVVNTGDDFTYLDLNISPDIDTLLYTLSNRADPERGWGRATETWSFMRAIAEIGGPTWFQLGDGDLALHVERTRRLRMGQKLTSVTAEFTKRYGIASAILPITDDSISTQVVTDEVTLAFQEYFVRDQAKPRVRAIRFDGATRASPSAEVVSAFRSSALKAIVICPSNPFLSIDPILAIPGVRKLLSGSTVPIVAVSPLVGGKAVKGPTAKIMAELNIPTTPRAISDHYRGLIDGLVVDVTDRLGAADVDVPTLVTGTMMTTLEDKKRVARATLAFAASLEPRRARK
jgi:LPPG:FO 2-phospho-L-lactate transferase